MRRVVLLLAGGRVADPSAFKEVPMKRIIRALAILLVFSGPALAQLPPDPTGAANLFVPAPAWPGLVAEDVCVADTVPPDFTNALVCDFGPFGPPPVSLTPRKEWIMSHSKGVIDARDATQV